MKGVCCGDGVGGKRPPNRGGGVWTISATEGRVVVCVGLTNLGTSSAAPFHLYRRPLKVMYAPSLASPGMGQSLCGTPSRGQCCIRISSRAVDSASGISSSLKLYSSIFSSDEGAGGIFLPDAQGRSKTRR